MIKVFKLIIDLDDETGLTFNALVERPAHNKKLIAFNKEDNKKSLLFFDDNKRMITGVAISANQMIFRNDPQFGEYYVYFEPKEIEKMVRKMSKQQLLSSVNIMHDSKNIVKGMTFIEGYFVSDTKRPPNDTENVQDGSYVMTYYVEDETLYKELKNGRYAGYSVEGIFDQIPIKYNYKQKTKTMKKGKLFNMIFSKGEKFAEVTTTDGVVLSYEGELSAGVAIFITTEDGENVAASEGTYELEDGTTVVVDANGMVTSVTAPEAVEDVELSEVVDMFRALNTKIDKQAAEFKAFKEAQVKGVKKFERKEGAKTLKEILAGN